MGAESLEQPVLRDEREDRVCFRPREQVRLLLLGQSLEGLPCIEIALFEQRVNSLALDEINVLCPRAKRVRELREKHTHTAGHRALSVSP